MSEIMRGVLNMPPSCWSGDSIDVHQRHTIYVQAGRRMDELEAIIERLKRQVAEQSELVHIQCDWLSPIEAAGLRAENKRLLDLIRRYAPSLLVMAAPPVCRCAEIAANRPDPGMQAQSGLHFRGCPAGEVTE